MMSGFSNERDREKLDVLTGARGDKKQAAVRVSDLDAILKLSQIQAKPLDAPPTTDQYNTLLKDVQNIADALSRVGQALQGKIRT